MTTTPSPVRTSIARSPLPPTTPVFTSPRPRLSALLLARAVQTCLLALVAVTLLQTTVLAESPAYRWASRAGGTGHDYGTGITVDSEGNTFVCGYFRGQARFNNETAVAGKGEADIFLAKYNRIGELVWCRRRSQSSAVWIV